MYKSSLTFTVKFITFLFFKKGLKMIARVFLCSDTPKLPKYGVCTF